MQVYNDRAIRGFLYCLFVQDKPPENAFSELREVAETLKIPLTWTFNDVHHFYTKIFRDEGELRIEKRDEMENEYHTLKGFIYCMVWLEAHERAAPIGTLDRIGSIFTTKDVDAMFKRIYEGGYTMLEWKGEEYPPEHLLANLPHMIQKQVAEYLAIEDRLLFRATCHQFRSLTDKTPIYLRKLTIRYGAKWNRIITSDGFNIKYTQHENREDAMVKKDKKCMEMEDCDGFLGEFQAELKRIFEWENLTIGELSIGECMCECYDEATRIDENLTEEYISEVLENLKHYVIVEKLSFHVGEIYVVPMYLKSLDPESIKSLEIIRHQNPWVYETEMEPMFKMEQWKRAETFLSDRAFMGEKHFAESFSHFNYARFHLFRGFFVEEIVKMKENLLKNPNLNQIKMVTRFSKEEDLEKLNNVLGTHGVFKSKNPTWTHFNYPGSSKNEKLSIMVTEKLIWFKGPKFVEDPPDEEWMLELNYTALDHNWTFPDDEGNLGVHD